MALFSLAECSLAVRVLALAFLLAKDRGGPFMQVDRAEEVADHQWGKTDITYAARFWALRLLCAGVAESFSSLLLRPVGSRYGPSSPSIDVGPGLVLLCTSLLDTDCFVNESGGECGGIKDEEGSRRKEGSNPGQYWL